MSVGSWPSAGPEKRGYIIFNFLKHMLQLWPNRSLEQIPAGCCLHLLTQTCKRNPPTHLMYSNKWHHLPCQWPLLINQVRLFFLNRAQDRDVRVEDKSYNSSGESRKSSAAALLPLLWRPLLLPSTNCTEEWHFRSTFKAINDKKWYIAM